MSQDWGSRQFARQCGSGCALGMTVYVDPHMFSGRPGPLRSEHFVLCVAVGGVVRKLARVIFQRSDGSVLLAFAYYEHTKGVLNHAVHERGSSTISTIGANAKVTSHGVKYAHHPDGIAHFSGDGKIYTEIERQSVPLDRINAQIFRLHVQGLHAFKEAGGRPTVWAAERQKTMVMMHDFGDTEPRAVEIVGFMHTYDDLTAEAPMQSSRLSRA